VHQAGFYYTDISKSTVNKTQNLGFVDFRPLTIIKHAKMEKENFSGTAFSCFQTKVM
jgi:hypothetical protein